ncbi:hypothetical protein T01_159 [Trichinella spiralis]|uniref:Uncharacterized protein n=1 Tax=Trichinella spiralis TaxID=6334 RepID=A0A0V1BXX4_TRISP|nr:hypothetical protein T01_159 [Trichinella spiralis]
MDEKISVHTENGLWRMRPPSAPLLPIAPKGAISPTLEIIDLEEQCAMGRNGIETEADLPAPISG